MKKSYYYLSEKIITKVSVNLILLFFITSISSFSCNDSSYDVDDPCGCDSETIARYEDVEGTVIHFGAEYYIYLHVPNGFYVEPCEDLNDDFKIDKLEVKVSGEMKSYCKNKNINERVLQTNPFLLQSIELKTVQK